MKNKALFAAALAVTMTVGASAAFARPTPTLKVSSPTYLLQNGMQKR